MNTRCPSEGHTYLTNLQLKAAGLSMYELSVESAPFRVNKSICLRYRGFKALRNCSSQWRNRHLLVAGNWAALDLLDVACVAHWYDRHSVSYELDEQSELEKLADLEVWSKRKKNDVVSFGNNCINKMPPSSTIHLHLSFRCQIKWLSSIRKQLKTTEIIWAI